jgi:hypothetical protein
VSKVDPADLAVRNLTYRLFVEHGEAPTAEAAAEAAGLDQASLVASWQRLHDLHAIVLQPDAFELRMANPFSAIPTAYRVLAGGRSWYANCAWDAFGICAALHTDGRIETSCRHCGEEIECAVTNRQPSDEQLLFHCLVPAAQWWNDIVFT